MKLEEAKVLANELVEYFNHVCSKVEVVGSILRNKQDPKDIDIILIPKPIVFQMAVNHLHGITIKREGEKLISFDYKGQSVDLYICTPKIYEVIRLIRTGSTLHNIKLCTIAKNKGWSLKANGDGLVDDHGRVIADTEKDILEKLLGKWIIPEERE